jgi:hypothetical protein
MSAFVCHIRGHEYRCCHLHIPVRFDQGKHIFTKTIIKPEHQKGSTYILFYPIQVSVWEFVCLSSDLLSECLYICSGYTTTSSLPCPFQLYLRHSIALLVYDLFFLYLMTLFQLKRWYSVDWQKDLWIMNFEGEERKRSLCILRCKPSICLDQ